MKITRSSLKRTFSFSWRDLLGVPNPLIGENIDELGTRFPDMGEVYAPELQEKVRKAAEKLQVPLQEGVYMQFTGPSYETCPDNFLFYA